MLVSCRTFVFQATPPIVLGDGSNLKCGVSWQPFFCSLLECFWLVDTIFERLEPSRTSCATPALVPRMHQGSTATLWSDVHMSVKAWALPTRWVWLW